MTRHAPMVATSMAILALIAACGSATPTPTPGRTAASAATATPGPSASPTPSPTATPVPTPLPSLPALDVTAFGKGWTLAARAANVGEHPGTVLRSTIGSTVSVIAVCTGEGTMTVTLRAAGGRIKDKAGVDVGSVPVTCPSVEPAVTRLDLGSRDYHGVTVTPSVTADDGVTYLVLVGTHG